MSDTYKIAAMPNAHSHAFQLQLRGIAERPAPEAHAQDDFWSWRTEMFRLAATHEPDSMRAVATTLYTEMVAAGYGAVGEFHYVHHRPDGTPYEQPNAMAFAVVEAAEAAGIDIVLLPAAYHRNGDQPLQPGQVRFCDPDVESYLARVDALRAWAAARPRVHVGVAAHSVRAVPAAWLTAIAEYSDTYNLVRHIHAHEQRRELAECEAEHGCTPIELLRRTGFLGARTSIIHGVHVTPDDIAAVAESDTIIVSCPTTEGSLGDGYLPALRYRDAGVRLAIGSDSQVRIDPFEEARELETLARRERQTRFALLSHYGDLWAELVRNGRASLGLQDAPEPTIAIDTTNPQIAGVAREDLPRALVTAASAAVVVA